MFYICKGTCLCLSGQGQGSIVYCYGDPSARNLHQLQMEQEEEDGGFLSLGQYGILDIAQLAVYTLGIVSILIALILIRNSVNSLEQNLSSLWSVLDIEMGPDHGNDTLSNLSHLEAGHNHCTSNGNIVNTNPICDL